MQIRLESYDEKRACSWADQNRILHIKLNLTGRRGWPDRLFILTEGRTLWVEFKRQGEKPEPLQGYVHRQLFNRGHTVHVLTRWQDCTALLEALLGPEALYEGCGFDDASTSVRGAVLGPRLGQDGNQSVGLSHPQGAGLRQESLGDLSTAASVSSLAEGDPEVG